jgi:hypothetical protein
MPLERRTKGKNIYKTGLFIAVLAVVAVRDDDVFVEQTPREEAPPGGVLPSAI